MHINSVKLQTRTTVNRILENIFDLIPQTKLTGKSRSVRSFLPFIGQLSKGLFGTATMDDVNILARHINALVRRTQGLYRAMSQHDNHMSSYMTLIDDRINNLKQGITNNFNTLKSVLHSFRYNYEHLEQVMTNISSIISDQVYRANHVQNMFLNLQSSIQTLINGRISPFLINKEILISTLHGIQQILKEKYPKFHLVMTDVSQLYRNANVFLCQEPFTTLSNN